MSRAASGQVMEKKREKENKNINPACPTPHTLRFTGVPFPGPLSRKTEFLSEILLCSLTTQLITEIALRLT